MMQYTYNSKGYNFKTKTGAVIPKVMVTELEL